jgi:hypothetical protein
MLEPPQGRAAHRHGACLHVRLPLLRGGGHRASFRHASAGGARHRRGPAGEAGASARDRARVRPPGLRVHSPARTRAIPREIAFRPVPRRGVQRFMCCYETESGNPPVLASSAVAGNHWGTCDGVGRARLQCHLACTE